jgi:hypothetical protein
VNELGLGGVYTCSVTLRVSLVTGYRVGYHRLVVCDLMVQMAGRQHGEIGNKSYECDTFSHQLRYGFCTIFRVKLKVFFMVVLRATMVIRFGCPTDDR